MPSNCEEKRVLHVLDLSKRDMQALAMMVHGVAQMLRAFREEDNAGDKMPSLFARSVSMAAASKYGPGAEGEKVPITDDEQADGVVQKVAFCARHLLGVERLLAQVGMGMMRARTEACDCPVCKASLALVEANCLMEDVYYQMAEAALERAETEQEGETDE